MSNPERSTADSGVDDPLEPAVPDVEPLMEADPADALEQTLGGDLDPESA